MIDTLWKENTKKAPGKGQVEAEELFCLAAAAALGRQTAWERAGTGMSCSAPVAAEMPLLGKVLSEGNSAPPSHHPGTAAAPGSGHPTIVPQ